MKTAGCGGPSPHSFTKESGPGGEDRSLQAASGRSFQPSARTLAVGANGSGSDIDLPFAARSIVVDVSHFALRSR